MKVYTLNYQKEHLVLTSNQLKKEISNRVNSLKKSQKIELIIEKLG